MEWLVLIGILVTIFFYWNVRQNRRKKQLAQIVKLADIFIISLHSRICQGNTRLCAVSLDKWIETFNVAAVFMFAELLLNVSLSETAKMRLGREYLEYVASKYANSLELYQELSDFLVEGSRIQSLRPQSTDELVCKWIFLRFFDRRYQVGDSRALQAIDEAHTILMHTLADLMELQPKS